jgi:phosphoesterase RecJ-like protein
MYNVAKDLIHNSHYILIVTHINPDADTISCALALSNYCFENNIKHKVFNKQNNLPNNLDYLNRFDKITNTFPKYYDLAVYVDCGDKKRADIDLEHNCKLINIDHHQSNDLYGDYNFVDDTKASTAEVLYDFFIQNDMNISKNTATCLYTGIYSDSLGFTTPRTDASTFSAVNNLITKGIDVSYIAVMLNQRQSLAKYRLLPKILDSLELHNEGKIATIYVLDEWLKETGATYMDCDDAVDMVLSISIVQIAIFLRVSNGFARISLRSKKQDVSKIANKFNGGGHKNAAGCKIQTGDIFEAKKILVDSMKDL